MDRREFLAKAGLVSTWALVGITISSCSSDDGSPSAPAATGVTGVVSVSAGHSHSGATVTQAQLDAGNAVTLTLTGSGHTHTVQLDASQVMDIADGTQVVVTSSNSGTHDHTVTFN
ncbi:MAG: hypothetical protein R3C71_04790 [Candidatus Krumholzibacteriia bacterium]|nr:hypothetical protein [bacterium]